MTTCVVMNYCANHSPSALSPEPSPPRFPARLANRPGAQQPGQKGNRRKQRMLPLPRLKLNLRPGVTIDLPRDVVRTPRECETCLSETQDGQNFSLNPPPCPAS